MVVGSGAGGGAMAYRLARRGWRVLIIERGFRLDAHPDSRSERAMFFERRASDDRPLLLNGKPNRLAIGGVTGGGTSLYGATLARPSPWDFEPGRLMAERLDRELWEWPISYDTLEPYLELGEDLLGVAGDHQAPSDPLGRRRKPYSQPPPNFAPINETVAERLERRALP